ncbi:hypothetical protein YH62_23275 [Rhizobium sp. LC145]|nr:hypothetical protein YH62_23275 [Rhizobium sp. LC145]
MTNLEGLQKVPNSMPCLGHIQQSGLGVASPVRPPSAVDWGTLAPTFLFVILVLGLNPRMSRGSTAQTSRHLRQMGTIQSIS